MVEQHAPHAEAALLDGLNPAQRRAVTHAAGPQLIVAGAGTGKTTVIAKRIAWLVLTQDVPTDGVLALTFTDKAAAEMEERVDRLLPYGYVDLWISTFHRFCDRILSAHALDIGLPRDYRLIDGTAAWLLMREHLDRFNLDYYRPRGNPTKFLQALHEHFSRCKDEAILPADYLRYAQDVVLDSDRAVAEQERSRLAELAHAYHVYEQILLDAHALDFGDLLLYTLELLRTRPAILEQYRAQFPYLLVDEFQDTNWAQYEIVRILAAPRNNLTVVGDDDQSIYAFRGAAMSNIIHFKEDYPNAAETAITTNYRSRQEILDAAYALITENNPDRLEVRLALNKRLVAAAGGGGSVEVLRAADGASEAQLVTDRIVALRDAGIELSEIAILVRANSHAEQFLPFLEARGIPYLHLASRGLYRTEPVLDILAYLQLLADATDSPACYRVLNIPVFGFTYDDLLFLTTYAGRMSTPLFSVCRAVRSVTGITEATAAKVERIVTRIVAHAELARHAPVRDVILAFLNDPEYGYLRDMTDEETAEDHERVRYLTAFWKRVEAFEAGTDAPTAARFMEVVRLEREAGETGAIPLDPDAGPDAVRVLTIHASKGLEFRHVFVVNAIEQRFPSANRTDAIPLPEALTKAIVPDADTHLQEERRLCYVAATRAKEGLVFSYADDYGGARTRKPSRFLAELGLPALDDAILATGRFRRPLAKPLTPGLPKHAFPVKVSYTQVTDYLTCPWMYHYRHILQIPIPMHGKGAISFGKTIHRTLERFFSAAMERSRTEQGSLLGGGTERAAPRIPSREELLAWYEESWVPDWYLNTAERTRAHANGRELLRTFYAQHEREGWPDVLAVEQHFIIKVDEVSVTGSIDRVDALSTGGIALVDYKTGKRPTRFDRDAKRQLFLYQLAARDLLQRTPEALSYVYFDGKSPTTFLGTEGDLAELTETIVGTYRAIRSEAFDPTPDLRTCARCEYRTICPFSKA